MLRSTVAAALVSAAALTVGAGPAAASDSSSDLGRHIASCAQQHLGQRDAPPAVTCAHDGTTMTFPTFGAMVEHMREHHG